MKHDVRCIADNRALTFIFDEKEARYTLEKYRSDEELVRKIQTGKGDPVVYEDKLGVNIFIEVFFGGMTPSNPR